MSYSAQQLEQALVKAHESGDTENARILAGELHKIRQQSEQQTKYQAVMAGDVDNERGAPASVRAIVSSAYKPEDKLATLQKYYPDARPHGEDNFIFTDPETGRLTTYNPEGLDMGDVAEFARVIPETLGGIGGGALGSFVAPGAGTLAGGAVGAEVGGQGYDLLMRKLFDVEDTRTAAQTLGDAAINTGINFVAGKAGEVAGNMLDKFGNSIRRGVGKPVKELVEAGEEIGVNLPLGVVSGNKGVQQLEETLSKIPTSAETIGSAYAETLEGMGKFALDNARELSEISDGYDIGQSIIKGANDYTGKFKQQSNELYDDLWNKLPADGRVSVDTTKEALKEITEQFKDDPAFQQILGSKSLDAFKKAFESSPEGVTVNTLKALRTKVGSQLQDSNLLNDAAQAELKKLYGALSDDLEVAAINAGDEAYTAWNKANDFYRGGREIIDNTLNPLVKGGVAENVYRRVFGDKGQVIKKPNLEEIQTLMTSLPKETRNDISAEFIRRMGQATAGGQDATGEVFSANRFLTNYNRLTPAVKSELFNKETNKALDNLASVSAAMKDRAGVANTSGTAAPVIMSTLLMDAFSGSGGAATGVAGFGYGAGKLFTSPKFVNWLTKTAEDGSSKSALGRNIGLLVGIAQESPTIRSELYQYAENLRSYQGENKQAEQQEPAYF